MKERNRQPKEIKGKGREAHAEMIPGKRKEKGKRKKQKRRWRDARDIDLAQEYQVQPHVTIVNGRYKAKTKDVKSSKARTGAARVAGR